MQLTIYLAGIILYTTLQAWRATACLLVVIFHISINIARDNYFGSHGTALRDVFCFGGNAGVSFFFVLSGFIICHAHRNEVGKKERIFQYLRKRAYRIYPTYWIIFLIAYILSLIFPPASWQMPESIYVIISALFLAPIPDGSIKAFSSPILSVAWTLRFELIFYAFFLLFFIGRKIFIASCMTVFAMATYKLFNSASNNTVIDIASSHFMLLFLTGVGAAQFASRPLEVRKSRMIFHFGWTSFLGGGLVFCLKQGEVDRALSDLAFGVASACLIVGSLSLERMGQKNNGGMQIKSQLLRDVGDASYAIYLIHYPLVALICKIGVKTLPINDLGVAITLTAALAASVWSGIWFHTWIEAPLLKKLNNSDRTNRTY